MKVVINHLTRMQSGYICVAGVEVHARQHVRLMPRRAHLRPQVLVRNGGLFDMGAILDIGVTRSIASPPQVEDCEFDMTSVKTYGTLAGPRFWNMVTQMGKTSLRALFGDDLGRYRVNSCAVPVGKGIASLGCLSPKTQPTLYVRSRPGKPPQVRMQVNDGEFDLDVGVTDLRLYAADHVAPDTERIEQVAQRLRDGEPVILSVGLTRPFSPSPDVPEMHWLQVNNVHFQEDQVWQFG